MLKQTEHKIKLIDILKSLYGDPDLRTILGFKGGTAAMLFYDLPRLSVDLDFDLLDVDKKELVFMKMKTCLKQHGSLRHVSPRMLPVDGKNQRWLLFAEQTAMDKKKI